MAKIRKEGKHPVSEGGLTDYDPVPFRREEVGPSPKDGKPLHPSSETDATNTQEPTATPRKPALTTESPLPPDATEPSDANSTVGNGPMTKTQQSVKKAPAKATKKTAHTRSTVDNDDEDDF